MIIFQMTSPKSEVDYQFKFDTQGRIVGFEIMGDNTFSDEHTRTLFSMVPATVGALKQFAAKNKIVLTEIKPDLSFQTFWEKYGKIGSKPVSEKLWNKFSEKDKNLAMNYIPKYLQNLNSTAQAYANTYLNRQYWVK